MTTKPLVAASSGSTHQLPASSKNANLQLKPTDFIKMMITQLQNQDPLQPEQSDQLLAQMSQIGQLQSSTMLQQSITGMALQSQIGSAGNLIGKSVTGLDDNNNPASGLVNSIHVQDNSVYLELDNGKSLAMGRVTNIAPGPSGTSAATTGSTVASKAA